MDEYLMTFVRHKNICVEKEYLKQDKTWFNAVLLKAVSFKLLQTAFLKYDLISYS